MYKLLSVLYAVLTVITFIQWATIDGYDYDKVTLRLLATAVFFLLDKDEKENK